MRLMGLGDSLTQGVGDPRPGRAGFAGELDGWVTHFADAVRAAGNPVDVRNVAVAGARLDDVITEQLGVARAFRADITSCVIGVNDLWDVNLDLDVFAIRFHRLFAELAAISPVVITGSIHDVFAPFPMRQALRDKVNANIARMNTIINESVAEHGLVLVDFANRSSMFSTAVKAVDLLHPNRYGHQLIAAEVLGELQKRDLLAGVTAPAAARGRRGAPDLAHLAWVGRYVNRNWRRWRAEMAASKAASGGARTA